MAMRFHNNRRRLILLGAGFLALMGALAQTLQRGPSRNPHGALTHPLRELSYLDKLEPAASVA